MTDNRPIGLFDSGIGGLTVLRSLLTALPNESFVYLGDTARLPYGSKSASTIERYLAQNVNFLKSQNVKAVVVACNSASTVLLGKKSENDEIPIYNVIEPGAALALRTSVKKVIGVLGTRATVSAQAYVRAIQAIEPTATVIQQACPLLVPLVEEGWEEDPLTNLVIYRYVTPVMKHEVDTLIMGCTHYPALRGGIQRVTGPKVTLLDSAEAIADLIRSDLSSGRLKPGNTRAPLRIMATDVSPAFFEVATRLMRPHSIPKLEAVDL